MANQVLKVGDTVVAKADIHTQHSWQLPDWLLANHVPPGTITKIVTIHPYAGSKTVCTIEKYVEQGRYLSHSFELYMPTPKKKIEAFLKGQIDEFNSDDKTAA